MLDFLLTDYDRDLIRRAKTFDLNGAKYLRKTLLFHRILFVSANLLFAVCVGIVIYIIMY